MVEYGIMVALIAVVSVLVIGALGFDVFAAFDTTQETIGPALSHCDHPHAIHSPVHC
jgi:Flp pilus assembly pilin Flp